MAKKKRRNYTKEFKEEYEARKVTNREQLK